MPKLQQALPVGRQHKNTLKFMAVNIDDYTKELECDYKEEHYSVRDNGAILRHSRLNKKPRQLDNNWTFGYLNDKGYLIISSEVVHRIVAFAFLGQPPTNQHVVDHIDTNRQNNRPENLRWLTRLENILNNPITRKRIILSCGSIEAFLADPSILKNYEKEDANFAWMKTVTPEEAKLSWERLTTWANSNFVQNESNKNTLGEWLFSNVGIKSNQVTEPVNNGVSLTLNAIQKDWKTPTEFYLCPTEITTKPIKSYFDNLEVGKTFSNNQFNNSVIEDFAISKDENSLWILCQTNKGEAIKPWNMAEITFENEKFVHHNIGSFFTKLGAEKRLTILQGLEWKGEDSVDDYC